MTSPLPPMLDQALLARVRETVRAVEPGAQVILYGSRARGDAEPESDWDLLVLLGGPVTAEREDAVRHRLYDLELAADVVLSTLIYSRDRWDSPLYRSLPFHANVERDGVTL